MKLTKTQLREIIREELKEAYIDPDKAPKMLADALDELRRDIFNVVKYKGKVEGWAEKYHRSVPGMLDMISRMTKILKKMK